MVKLGKSFVKIGSSLQKSFFIEISNHHSSPFPDLFWPPSLFDFP